MAYNKVRRSEFSIFLLDDGRWLVDIRLEGSNDKRHREIKPTKAEAVRYKTALLAKANAGDDWYKPAADRDDHYLIWLIFDTHSMVAI